MFKDIKIYRFSSFMTEGIKKEMIPSSKITEPEIRNALATPMVSAMNPVARIPTNEGNKLKLPKRENTRPRAVCSIWVCRIVVNSGRIPKIYSKTPSCSIRSAPEYLNHTLLRIGKKL